MLVDIERHERVAVLTLNRPESRNAINVGIPVSSPARSMGSSVTTT
jgi:enoyl-CoA hydratase/carnithine racemase